MRKIIGIGETILDILFRDGQPTAAVPGGSVFNGVVSLARMGVPVEFITEVGNDRVGEIILDFMRSNGMETTHVNVFPNGKSPVSLAFLNERSDAEYIFYKDYPKLRLEVDYPDITDEDILILGSYYALSPLLRDKVVELLERARQAGAIIYYDPNFRAPHKEEAIKLNAALIENLEYADIVRGSSEDFLHLYGLQEGDKVYKEKIKFYCPNFIYTQGGNEVILYTDGQRKTYAVPPIEAVSTIGAGDNFNAGLLYGLLKEGIHRDDLPHMDQKRWDRIVATGIAFSANVCQSVHNSVSMEFAEKMKAML
ncbi:MAG: carbohydrate kinase [Bacteroides sp.]|nr:carbohydrate kinase [Bacteroides sp.]